MDNGQMEVTEGSDEDTDSVSDTSSATTPESSSDLSDSSDINAASVPRRNDSDIRMDEGPHYSLRSNVRAVPEAAPPPSIQIQESSQFLVDLASTPQGSQQHQESQPHSSLAGNAIESSSKEPENSVSVQQKSKVETSFSKESADDDGQTCTICFEPWTNSSEHRLVSLRCGHLFGRSCITRWLRGQNTRCPQCNARARKSEIRNIYAKCVKAVDSSEKDKALQDLLKENELRRKAEMNVAHERLKHMLAVQECERLKKELMAANMMLQEYRSSGKLSEKVQSSKQTASVFSFEKNIEIAKHGGCRIVDISELLGIILISQPSVNELFPGYGFRKVSTLDMKPSEFVWVHQKPIRDMAFHDYDGLVLTASLDKSVRITNVLSNTIVQTYNVDSDVWSCTWDADDTKYFYAGLKTGAVLVFDIRVTSRHVHELPRFGCNTPVVALQYLRKATSLTHSKCGPVVGKLSDSAFFEKGSQTAGEYRIAPLPHIGPFISLSSEPVSGHFLVSCRPSPKQPRVTHTLCELAPDQSGDLACNPVQTILGGRTQVQLTRSKLLMHPDKESSLLVCAGDEDANGALIWDGSSGTCLDHLKTDSPVLDIDGLRINHKSFLTALTDKSLRLYRWTS